MDLPTDQICISSMNGGAGGCADGELDQLSARVHVQFVHYPLAVTGNRLRTEAKAIADLLVVRPLSYQLQHLPL